MPQVNFCNINVALYFLHSIEYFWKENIHVAEREIIEHAQ